MARKSRLSEEQWNRIITRNLNGESIRSLAREFGITETAIRKRISSHTKQIKSVAKQIVTVEEKLSSMPISSQIQARTYADRLRAISNHMASAAEYGAATAHRLSQIANSHAEKIDDVFPEASIEAIKTVSVLTRTANEAADLGVRLAKVSAGNGLDESEEKKIALLSDEALYQIAAGGGAGADQP